MTETALLLARKAADVLAERGIEQARLDAELILAHVLGISRLELYLQFERPLTDQELDRFRALIRRRLKREPVQYLVGTAHFRHLALAVDPRVLIPRPETEELVGHVLDWAWAQVGGKPARARTDVAEAGTPPDDLAVSDAEADPAEHAVAAPAGQGGQPAAPARRLTALDLCTGSGAIALSLLQEGPFERVVATDIAHDALAVARANAERLGLAGSLELRRGALWQAVGEDERFDVVVSNPPYVGEEERDSLAPEVAAWEPTGALFAGVGGLAVIEPIIAGASAHLRQGGLLALEIGAAQGRPVQESLERCGAFAGARVLRDLAGRDRVALAEYRSLAPDEKRGDHA